MINLTEVAITDPSVPLIQRIILGTEIPYYLAQSVADFQSHAPYIAGQESLLRQVLRLPMSLDPEAFVRFSGVGLTQNPHDKDFYWLHDGTGGILAYWATHPDLGRISSWTPPEITAKEQ